MSKKRTNQAKGMKLVRKVGYGQIKSSNRSRIFFFWGGVGWRCWLWRGIYRSQGKQLVGVCSPSSLLVQIELPPPRCEEYPPLLAHRWGSLVAVAVHVGGEALPDLLVLLDDSAAAAAPTKEAVLDDGALDVVPLADLAALERVEDPVETAASGGTKHDAVIIDQLMIGLVVAVLGQALRGPSVDNTRDEVSVEAVLEGLEAVEEASAPGGSHCENWFGR